MTKVRYEAAAGLACITLCCVGGFFALVFMGWLFSLMTESMLAALALVVFGFVLGWACTIMWVNADDTMAKLIRDRENSDAE